MSTLHARVDADRPPTAQELRGEWVEEARHTLREGTILRDAEVPSPADVVLDLYDDPEACFEAWAEELAEVSRPGTRRWRFLAGDVLELCAGDVTLTGLWSCDARGLAITPPARPDGRGAMRALVWRADGAARDARLFVFEEVGDVGRDAGIRRIALVRQP